MKVYARFIDLERAHESFRRMVLWQVLRIYDVGDKLNIKRF